jgi:hypothetical protein
MLVDLQFLVQRPAELADSPQIRHIPLMAFALAFGG